VVRSQLLTELDKMPKSGFAEPAGELDRAKRRARQVTRNVRKEKKSHICDVSDRITIHTRGGTYDDSGQNA